MNLKSDFIHQLKKTFPELQTETLETLISENLISPFTIELPNSVLAQAQKSVKLLFRMREHPAYKNHFKPILDEKGLSDPGNKSIMMSYDFHVDSENNLKLIEINTNAAFLILSHQVYEMKNQPLPVKDFSLQEISDCIQTELSLQGKKKSTPLKVAIIDEEPQQQRLFVEFLAYNELFKSWGWDSRILDYQETFHSFAPDFIYNRYTDFFLNAPSSAELRNKFLNKEVCLSPNPYEYLLLADKQRLIDWSEPGFLSAFGFNEEELQTLKTVIPISYDLCPTKADLIWSERKKLFFKPKNAFGSKQSFRGGSISRKAFDEILNQNMIAQEFIPAPEKTFETPHGPQNFKYDLRCYAYQGRLQMIIARLYQGQVTNLRTPFGGFGTVIFKN